MTLKGFYKITNCPNKDSLGEHRCQKFRNGLGFLELNLEIHCLLLKIKPPPDLVFFFSFIFLSCFCGVCSRYIKHRRLFIFYTLDSQSPFEFLYCIYRVFLFLLRVPWHFSARDKKIEHNEEKLRDHGYNIKNSGISVVGVPQRKQRENGKHNVCVKTLMLLISPTWERYTFRDPIWPANWKGEVNRIIPRYSKVKLLKITDNGVF